MVRLFSSHPRFEIRLEIYFPLPRIVSSILTLCSLYKNAVKMLATQFWTPSTSKLALPLYLPVILVQLFTSAAGDIRQASQTFQGVIGGGNYTYYKLTLDGVFILVLNSIQGDADLYVSQNNLYPTYDLDAHCLQSTTCGRDNVLIPSDFTRPVGIGVYGHPTNEISVYELLVYLEDEVEEKNQDYFNEDDLGSDYSKMDNLIPPMVKDEEESILWTILVGILKVLLEILAS